MALLTEREVADVFRVAPRTVRRWAAAGTLRPIRVGGVTRYRPADVAALILPAPYDDAPAANGRVGKERDAGAHAGG